MVITRNQAAEQYFATPAATHRTGDIWISLPTLGALKAPKCTGVVITPLCDLAWNKATTITYLPVLTFIEAVAEGLFIPEIRLSAAAAAGALSLSVSKAVLQGRSVISNDDLALVEAEFSSQRDVPAKHKSHFDRLQACIKILRVILAATPPPITAANLQACFSDKEWLTLRSAVVRNGHRADLHFLPPDGQTTKEWCAIPNPAVVLLRFPLSVPTVLLDLANSTVEEAWANALQNSALPPALPTLMRTRPIKALCLRDPFLHDLLMRFVALFSRLGSPDFTDSAVSQFATDISEL